MAKVHGNSGSLTFDNLTAGLKQWTLNHSGETHDVTDFADGTERKYISGLSSWTVTASGFWDSANASLSINDEATVTLYANGTVSSYSGAAICTAINVNQVVDDVITADFSFQGNGALTIV